jgi:arylesterase/paraoxonase
MLNLIFVRNRVKWKFILIVPGVFLLVTTTYTMVRLWELGAFITIEDQRPGTCITIAEVEGPEALQLDGENHMLYFISNNPCRQEPFLGGVYFLDLKSKLPLAQAFHFLHPTDFHPHGLSFFRDEKGQKYLFTNNHREDGSHTVEIFSIVAPDKLKHLNTISSPFLTSPNDLVAVAPDRFYVTNDGNAHDRFTRSLDTFLGRKTGSVLYFDGEQFTTLVDNLNFPNGIALNARTQRLFIGETLSGYVKVYQVVENNSLKNVDNFFLGLGLDNLSLDDQGGVLTVQHPNLWSLSRHMKQPNKRSPFKVLYLDPKTGTLKTLYQQSGKDISGASAALSYEGLIFLGAVCDNKLVKIVFD